MQTMTNALRHVLMRLHSLRRDERGVSAVEFAMILPLLVTAYLGCVEVTQGLSIDRKLSLTTWAVADLVAQKREGGSTGNVISGAEMSDIMNAAKAVISPYPNNELKVVVSSVMVDAQNVAKVDWSCQFNSTARSKGETVTLPPAMQVPSTSVIWAEASYAYKPTVGYVVTGTVNLKDETFARPRVYDSIGLTACS